MRGGELWVQFCKDAIECCAGTAGGGERKPGVIENHRLFYVSGGKEAGDNGERKVRRSKLEEFNNFVISMFLYHEFGYNLVSTLSMSDM